MDQCSYSWSLIRALQAVSLPTGDYAINDGWRNMNAVNPTPSSVNIGVIMMIVMVVAFFLLSRSRKREVSQTP